MKTVTIYPPAVIPDDPELCEFENTRCKSANLWDMYRCASFLETAIYKNKDGELIKCQQCKDLFKQSLSEEENAQRIHKNSP